MKKQTTETAKTVYTAAEAKTFRKFAKANAKHAASVGEQLLALAVADRPLSHAIDFYRSEKDWPLNEKGKPVGCNKARGTVSGDAANVLLAVAARFQGEGKGEKKTLSIDDNGELIRNPPKAPSGETGKAGKESKAKNNPASNANSDPETVSARNAAEAIAKNRQEAAEKTIIQVQEKIDTLRAKAKTKGEKEIIETLKALINTIETDII